MKTPKYKDLKFKDQVQFENWLWEKAKFIIHFEDKGQDFLSWWVDEEGEVLHSAPFQSAIWNGKMLDLDFLEEGEQPVFQDGRILNYKVKRLERK